MEFEPRFTSEHKVTLLTFAAGDRCWQKSAERLEKQFRSHFPDSEVICHNPESAEKLLGDKWTNHSGLLRKNTKGFGFWLWKPLLASHSLNSLPEGALLMYLDAGTSLNLKSAESQKRMQEYLNIAENQSALFFQQAHSEKNWTKPELLRSLRLPMREWDSGQYLGGIWILKNNPRTRSLLEEWLEVATRNSYELLLPPADSCSSNTEHRHDQSVISVLAKLRGFSAISDETYFAPDWDLFGRRFPIWATRLCSGVPKLYRNEIRYRFPRESMKILRSMRRD